MIQSILLFALGFLCAGLLALMIAPAIWRRAVRLTRKRVEASAPLTLAEIQADKDRVRAEFAMAARRLEIAAKASREKAAAQIIEINRNREELKSLSQQRMEETQAVAELNRKLNDLGSELRRKEEQLQRLAEKLASAETAGQQLEAEIEKLGGLYEEASFASSSRQIELVARESEIDRLRGDVSTFREQKEEAEERLRAAIKESRAKDAGLEAAEKRAADLETKINGMFATLADSDEKLGKRERELTQLREKSQEVRKNGDSEEPVPGMVSDRELFEKQLTLLTRENRQLKEELAAAQSAVEADRNDDAREGEALREQMSELAAQVVALTAMAEGADLPIAKALATSLPKPVNDDGETATSLADRVLALQKAASAS